MDIKLWKPILVIFSHVFLQKIRWYEREIQYYEPQKYVELIKV